MTVFLIVICGCITFVGLVKIAIKKKSYKKSIQPINVPTISAQMTESISAIQFDNEEQDTFELQSHSQIINVAPIHLEEESVDSLKNNNIQTLNLPIENNEPNSVDVGNSESEETSEIHNQVVQCFNNQKFNPNLISSTGLAFLFVTIFIVGPFYIWHLSFADDFDSFVFKTHIYYCLPTALATIYFIVNPKRLITGMKNVSVSCM